MIYVRWAIAFVLFGLIAVQLFEYQEVYRVITATRFIEQNQAHIAIIAMLAIEFLLGLSFTVKTDVS